MDTLKAKHRQRSTFGIILCLTVFAIHPSLPEKFEQVPGRRTGTASPRARTTNLTPQQISEDLDQFQTELEERFAYLKVIDADYKTAIEAIRAKSANGLILDEFAHELEKVIALFIDCHASISGHSAPEGYLPFQMEPIENRAIAFWRDRSDFLHPAFPFITRIDGKSMEEWEQIIQLFIPKGSPQFVRTNVLRYLEFIQFSRVLADSEQNGDVIVDIRHNRGGTRNVLRELFPYFVSSSDPPHVAGAAKYKLYKDFGTDHLDYRNMHTQDWSGWSLAESTAISDFMLTFNPEWDPPLEEFLLQNQRTGSAFDTNRFFGIFNYRHSVLFAYIEQP